eukprot:1155681-Pelagomonas_calceolata.AAC.2
MVACVQFQVLGSSRPKLFVLIIIRRICLLSGLEQVNNGEAGACAHQGSLLSSSLPPDASGWVMPNIARLLSKREMGLGDGGSSFSKCVHAWREFLKTNNAKKLCRAPASARACLTTAACLNGRSLPQLQRSVAVKRAYATNDERSWAMLDAVIWFEIEPLLPPSSRCGMHRREDLSEHEFGPDDRMLLASGNRHASITSPLPCLDNPAFISDP